MAFCVLIVKVYVVPVVSPLTLVVVVVGDGLTVVIAPVELYVTRYPVIEDPPFAEGAVQLSVTLAIPADAVKPVGASGNPGVRVITAGIEEPFAFIATTENV